MQRSKKTDTQTIIPINSKVKEIITRIDLSEMGRDQHIKEIANIAEINEDVLTHKAM